MQRSCRPGVTRDPTAGWSQHRRESRQNRPHFYVGFYVGFAPTSASEIARDRKVSRSAIQKVPLPGATLECMRCENQYPLGETGLARYLSERGCNELGLKRGSACVSTAAPSVGSRKARGAADKCSSGVSRVMP